MRLYRTANGYLVEHGNRFYEGHNDSWDRLVTREDIEHHLKGSLSALRVLDDRSFTDIEWEILPPIVSQEVWASGVTYFRSRNARMDESRS